MSNSRVQVRGIIVRCRVSMRAMAAAWLAVCLGFTGQARAEILTTATWVGGVGVWSDEIMWSTNPKVPNNGFDVDFGDVVFYSVVIPAASTVSIDFGPDVNNLTLAAGAELNWADNWTFDINTAHPSGGTINNNGLINMNDPGGTLDLNSGTADLTGTGTILINGATITGSPADNLINHGNTIHGFGAIGFVPITNRATVRANVNGQQLSINNSSGVNSGLIEAVNGGILRMSAANFTNFEGLTDGTFRFNPGSKLELITSNITGGVVEIIGDGVIEGAGAIRDGTFTNSSTGILRPTNTIRLGSDTTNPVGGLFEVNNGRQLELETGHTYSNEGTITLNSTGSGTLLRIAGDVTLSGGGSVLLSDHVNNTINAVSGAPTFTNEDNTIEGAGFIGDAAMKLINNGAIRANATSSLTIRTPASQNNGLIEAVDGGTLITGNNTVFTGDGTWRADNNAELEFNFSNITTTSPVTITDNSTLDINVSNLTASDLVLDQTSSIDVGNNSTVTLTGDLSFAMTDESKWAWFAGTPLRMNGGVGAVVPAAANGFSDWASLEIGGHDIGIDPPNHVGDPAGFSNNFDLSELVIGPGAHVYLADLINNGNRGGPYGNPEALYVDKLTLSADAVLNLNGLHIYYTTLMGSTSQIIDVPIPEPTSLALLLLLGSAALLSRRR